MLEEVIKLEERRTKVRFWAPVPHIFRWGPHDVPENADHNDDDDPDVIQGLHPVDSESTGDLGLPKKRDPDALPPRNALELILNTVYHALNGITTGNSLFAIKAGLISVALCLPYLIQESAAYAFIGLGLSRFRGDTTFGLAARIIATFSGGLVGMVTWYISAGSGRGSPYSLAAVCGVCFPFFFMVRLYCPIPPMTNIVAFVTAILVLGYSYQSTHQFVPAPQGVGWDVAWRRFVLVTIGVVAAFLGSMLPPNMTLRRYQRSLLSTTCTELGTIYCSIITFATFTPRTQARMEEIISSLVATRAKLNRSSALSTNIVYEFSLRGRWPKKRYQQILELQLAIAYSLSHLMSVMEHLEPSWTRAFLKRARFLDPDFQGDVLAVISMISSSLRTGNPLPQVTPCPLLDRFMMRYHGLDVIHQDSEEDYGLPRLLTLDTLKDEQYLMFCVGISIAYRIMNRLDRLMLATKEIVGEQYHIHGVGVGAWNLDSLPSQGQGSSSGAGFPLSPSLTSQRGANTSAGISFGASVGAQTPVKEV
ncbi:hypothetical protein H1R20_g3236, partial [Candolleomyces eurysporus]